ncbi:UNVERIFIED_CONTAM: hypothetical protein PYX00_005312 [Menopon gallinae]|uniref:CCDC92/74 N-terminal domain-containing protein n=1 Tax=Menopon gallinae TaxID=328185 RepID=A0AAW2HRI5_9NEOP
MSSKVIVNIPSDPFQQINKKCQDLVNVDRATNFGLASTDPAVRVNQLEQNIRFLQEQHQIMLNGLHSEIEILRQRNRDLQFQIVFSKEGVTFVSSSSPSSDEDIQGRKIVLSPKQVNATPLQIELMERDIAELKTNLGEARTRNVYLQNIVDEQKKKLSSLENEKKVKVTTGKETNEELQEKLEDADRLIRRLRRENEEQRKEVRE